MAESLSLSGVTGIELVSATIDHTDELERVDREADLILLSREALACGLDERFERQDRIREWTYELDPSGLELLRRQSTVCRRKDARRSRLRRDILDGVREFHVSRAARERVRLPDRVPLPAGRHGAVVADVAAARRFAVRFNADRARSDRISAGELHALGLLHEIAHVVAARFASERGGDAFGGAVADLHARVGKRAVGSTLAAFDKSFPTTPAYRGDPDASTPPAAELLEELLLLEIANANPAAASFRDLFDDRDLAGAHPTWP